MWLENNKKKKKWDLSIWICSEYAFKKQADKEKKLLLFKLQLNVEVA